MSLLGFLVLLIIACICGSIAQALAGYSHGGCLVTTALGFIGALLGSWLARQFALPDVLNIKIGGTDFPIIWSIVGGALFAAILGFISRGRPHRV